MTTPKITYAHLLTEPNPKHVESLIKFFESGCQQRGTGGFCGGNENPPGHKNAANPGAYHQKNSNEEVLHPHPPPYDEKNEN